MPLFDVQTEKFGVILLDADNAIAARADAKKRFGVGPKAVSAHRMYRRCEVCESRPCVCNKPLSSI